MTIETRRRQIITALRAKADSSTFPEEAHALRTKADELEAKLGRIPPRPGWRPLSEDPDLQARIQQVMRRRGMSGVTFTPANPMPTNGDTVREYHFTRRPSGWVNMTIDFGPEGPPR